MSSIIYLACLLLTVVFGPKALHMSCDKNYSTPVTWGSLLFCLIAGVIPVINLVATFIIMYSYLEMVWKRLDIWKLLHKPIFPVKKENEWNKF